MLANVMLGSLAGTPDTGQTESMGLVYADLSVSADGFSTGYNQREEAPFGDGVEDEALHDVDVRARR